MSLIQTIKEAWGWIGIDPDKVVSQNEFGNLIIKDTAGKYWRLCPEDLYCSVIADNREELDKLTTDHEFVHDWFMQTLVDQAHHKLGPLNEDEKYYLVIPGPLGGAYAASNIQKLPLHQLVGLSGDIAQQIENLPDGAKIQLKVDD
ncbi:T6SS immunity protein Tdi1 domain-containing protein [Saccharospirillum sp. HFRX-1]|uniref:T6SS immunity protein Tdi1 domain-containing protein n=1 Tax=unclassified Saccharospirillum TaxID=2633430 RepID=UPI00371F4271